MGCTYQGVESGVPPLRLELYSDIMMALGHGVGYTRQEYMGSAHSGTVDDPALQRARCLLWKVLFEVPFFVEARSGTRMCHVGTTQE